MLTTTQAAAQLGLCQSRIRQLCLAGKLPGAYKMGRDWVIPENSIAALGSPARPTPGSGAAQALS